MCTQPLPSCIHTTQQALITFDVFSVRLDIGTYRKQRHTDVTPFSGQFFQIATASMTMM